MESKILALRVSGVKKKYRLGIIGGGNPSRRYTKLVGKNSGEKEDPNSKNWRGHFRKKTCVFMALKGISFDVYQGERLGIIGGNGAGKSTTLKILSRVTAPTEGENLYQWKNK